jgi:hypothetical protein
MEYLIGALTTLLVGAASYGFFSANLKRLKKWNITYTQSYNHDLVQPWSNFSIPKKPQVGQSYDFAEKHSLRVVLAKDKAYWIENGALLEAPLANNGQIDSDNKKRVDTMAMDAVELDTVSYIVEKLTEGRSGEDTDTRD